MDVSIVIVNYKTPELLLACVKSIYRFVRGCSFEVIVVDNESQDNSKALLLENCPDVTWIDMGSNAGFGTANNKGILKGKGKYTLLLNSDTEFYEDALTKTLKYYQELELKEKVGLLGCQVMYPDRRLQPSCNYFWAGIREVIEEHPIGIKVFQKWLKVKKLRSIDKYERLNTNHQITWLGVPFALINSEVIKSNLFDSRFFMYSEDEELNYRLYKKGYKHYYFAETGVYHYNGASSNNNDLRQCQILFSKLLFIRISRGRLYFKLYRAILKSGYKWDLKFSQSENLKNRISELEKGIKVVESTMRTGNMLNMYSK